MAQVFVVKVLAPGPVTLGIVFAVFEFSGLVWNIVSVSTRQRMIPDAMLGRVNSLYRLRASGDDACWFAAVGGLIVRVADGPLVRETALILPFWGAALGALILTITAWPALARGIAGDPDKKI